MTIEPFLIYSKKKKSLKTEIQAKSKPPSFSPSRNLELSLFVTIRTFQLNRSYHPLQSPPQYSQYPYQFSPLRSVIAMFEGNNSGTTLSECEAKRNEECFKWTIRPANWKDKHKKTYKKYHKNSMDWLKFSMILSGLKTLSDIPKLLGKSLSHPALGNTTALG